MASSSPVRAQPWISSRRSASSDALPSPPRTPSPPSSRGRALEAANWRRPSSCPTTSSPWSTGSWRTNASLPPKGPECRLGRVVELPYQHEIPADSIAHRGVAGDPWNHPVVITKTWEVNGVKLVNVRNCTSFGGKGVDSRPWYHRHYSVEADKSRLEHSSGEFEKPTWVNCSPGHELTIEFEHLRLWTVRGRKAIQFSQSALDSFKKNERSRRDSFLE